MSLFRLPALAAPLLLALLLPGCADAPLQLSGETMGTSWRVSVADAVADPQELRTAIAAELEALEQSMSHWRPDSELSRLNGTAVGEWLPVSEPLWQVLQLSLRVAEQTGGALDVTAGRLVNLWGFGPARDAVQPWQPPSADAIARARRGQGWRGLELAPGRARRGADFLLDLSAVAKGYAVDALSRLLSERGLRNHLVDIGGELVVSGQRAAERPWSLGIARPEPVATTAVASVVSLREASLSPQALATSGDYRNFYQWRQQRYSHLLNVAEGRPVHHDLLSVSVADTSCARADALATAFMVMGPEATLAWATEHRQPVLLVRAPDAFSAGQLDNPEFRVQSAGGWEEVFATLPPAP